MHWFYAGGAFQTNGQSWQLLACGNPAAPLLCSACRDARCLFSLHCSMGSTIQYTHTWRRCNSCCLALCRRIACCMTSAAASSLRNRGGHGWHDSLLACAASPLELQWQRVDDMPLRAIPVRDQLSDTVSNLDVVAMQLVIRVYICSTAACSTCLLQRLVTWQTSDSCDLHTESSYLSILFRCCAFHFFIDLLVRNARCMLVAHCSSYKNIARHLSLAKYAYTTQSSQSSQSSQSQPRIMRVQIE